MRKTLAVAITALLAAGCSASSPSVQVQPRVDETSTITAGTSDPSRGAGFEYDGRHYSTSCAPVRPEAVEPSASPADFTVNDSSVTAVHPLAGLDPDVMVAVKMEPCGLDPEATWRSAFGSDELTATGPSARLNNAWCAVAVHPPDPAEGFDC
jgi:hypothetical protein